MSAFSSRVRRWGFKPFVFRAPDKRNEQVYWMDRQDFKERLSLELKRDYARVFRVPDADELEHDSLMALFCKYNERVPILPLHEWRTGDSPDGRVIRRRATYTMKLQELVSTVNPRSRGEQDVPWLPKRSTIIPERLVPAEDEYSDSEDNRGPKKTANRQSTRKPPVRIEHALVYPPQAPVVGWDPVTGKDVVQPLSQDWLRIMLDEQETQYEALKRELQGAVDEARKAAGEVAMVRARMKSEEKEFVGFLDGIERICGPKTVKKIQGMAAFGRMYGFFEEGEVVDDGTSSEEEDKEEENHKPRTQGPSVLSEKRRREDDDDGTPGVDDHDAIERAEVERDIRPQKKLRINGSGPAVQPHS